MSEESRTNPYSATGNVGNSPMQQRTAPSARWLAVPFIALGGAVLAAVATFILLEGFMLAGDLSFRVAIGSAFIALIVGGVFGLIIGIGYARRTSSLMLISLDRRSSLNAGLALLARPDR